jgi:hypothetical protein
MKEVYEFRVREKYASRLFAPEEGVKLSQGEMFAEIAVRKIQISPDDPRFVQIGVIQAALKEHKNCFWYGRFGRLSRLVRNAAPNMMSLSLVLTARPGQGKRHPYFSTGDEFQRAKTSPEPLLVKLLFPGD